MVTVPGLTPVATPLAGSMVAIVVALVDHTPPVLAVVYVEVGYPRHIIGGPLIGDEASATVNIFVTEHPDTR
jgi:hypothetical protein